MFIHSMGWYWSICQNLLNYTLKMGAWRFNIYKFYNNFLSSHIVWPPLMHFIGKDGIRPSKWYKMAEHMPPTPETDETDSSLLITNTAWREHCTPCRVTLESDSGAEWTGRYGTSSHFSNRKWDAPCTNGQL